MLIRHDEFSLFKPRAFVVICLLLEACGHQSFRFTATDSIKLEAAEQSFRGPIFYGEGSGPIWQACNLVNLEATEDLLEKAHLGGYEAVADIKWFDFDKETWVKRPTCRNEYGWIAGTLYTFWWPTATKVRVQARGIKPEDNSNGNSSIAATSPKNTVGEKELSSRAQRGAKLPTTVAIELEGGLILGLGVKAGRFTDANVRWAANLELAVPWGETLGCHAYVDGWGTLAFRREQFLTDSFYFGLGPAFQHQRWHANCLSLGSLSDSQQSGKWAYETIGLDMGIGNEWLSSSGLMGGCEWVGGTFSTKVLRHGDELKEGGRTMPASFTGRILACHLGVAF